MGSQPSQTPLATPALSHRLLQSRHVHRARQASEVTHAMVVGAGVISGTGGADWPTPYQIGPLTIPITVLGVRNRHVGHPHHQDPRRQRSSVRHCDGWENQCHSHADLPRHYS